MAVDIILTVAGQGSGSGGESRQFAYSLIDPTPPLVTLSLDDTSGVTSYLWEILSQPIDASASLSSQSVASPTFTPTAEKWGTYLIRCTIIRNSVQEIGTIALSFRTPNRDMRFPAAGEKVEFSTANGWMEAEHVLYETVDDLSMTGYWSRTSTRLHPLTSGDTLQVGSGNITYPSYAYEADSDTGRYLFSTGVEAFACSGNAQIIFGSDGNPYIKAVDGHNILTLGNYKTIGGGEAELLIEADGNATTDGAIINFNAKSTAGKISLINILSDSDNGTTDLNITSDAGDTGTSSDIYMKAYGGDATINIEVDHSGVGNSGSLNLISSDDVLIDTAELFTVEAGSAASFRLYPTGGSGADIRFSDYYIYNNWTNQWIGLSDSSTESSTFTTNFGQVSIFAALNYLYSSGGVPVQPAGQVVYGTGTGITSSSDLTWSSSVLAINGKMTLDNAAWGTPDTASLSSNTLTVNFNTGKDFQTLILTEDADELSITAPSGGAAKGIVIRIVDDGNQYTIGGSTGWDSVRWEKNGTDLATTALQVGDASESGGYVYLFLIYDGSVWSGSIGEFHGVAV